MIAQVMTAFYLCHYRLLPLIVAPLLSPVDEVRRLAAVTLNNLFAIPSLAGPGKAAFDALGGTAAVAPMLEKTAAGRLLEYRPIKVTLLYFLLG